MHLPSGSLAIGVMMFVGSHIAFHIPRVMPWTAPLESPEEGTQRGGVSPRYTREDRDPRCLIDDEALKFQLEGYCRALDPKGEIREAVTEAVRQRESLTGGGPVMNVAQHVEHVSAVRHGGVWAQAMPDLLG